LDERTFFYAHVLSKNFASAVPSTESLQIIANACVMPRQKHFP
jgi:hypothetical protein